MDRMTLILRIIAGARLLLDLQRLRGLERWKETRAGRAIEAAGGAVEDELLALGAIIAGDGVGSMLKVGKADAESVRLSIACVWDRDGQVDTTWVQVQVLEKHVRVDAQTMAQDDVAARNILEELKRLVRQRAGLADWGEP